MSYNREDIEVAVKQKGYAWFDNGTDFNLNIVGVRNASSKNVTNVFDDYITLSYRDKGIWKFHIWEATTDPGKRGVMEYNNPHGVARLVEGQYRGSHTIGLHKGRYEALKQLKPVKVYRDSNRDSRFDETKINEGIFGINIHKAGVNSTYVENWSEGCQVFKKEADFNEFMRICKKAASIHGKTFTYTLINTNDIK